MGESIESLLKAFEKVCKEGGREIQRSWEGCQERCEKNPRHEELFKEKHNSYKHGYEQAVKEFREYIMENY